MGQLLKDCHHIFFPRKVWSFGYYKKLREFWYCKVQIPRDSLHRNIHILVKGVPLPKPTECKRVYQTLNSLPLFETDNFVTRLETLIRLFGDSPTADALRLQKGGKIMKVNLTLDSFPMSLMDMMAEDLKKRLPSIDVQIGGEDTVFVSFSTSDIVKVQEISIICDKYAFGGGLDGCEVFCRDENAP